MATWQITYAPYVADYSRYLPRNTSMRQIFWYTYAGSVIGSSWMMILGAISAIVAPKQSDAMVTYLGHLSSGVSFMTYLLIMFGVLAINTLNLYGAIVGTVISLWG
jgi:nucleobase:cation symporter-1, NCS1 family